MGEPLYLSEADVMQRLNMTMALDAVASAHRAHALGRAVDVPRQRTRTPTSALHILQGALLDEGVMGYKAYTTARAGSRFRVYLFNATTAALLAEIEADYLGMMRTGAAGGVAARYLARAEAATVVLFGCGWQAQSQLAAICAVRPIRRVLVLSRDAQKRAAFCAAQSARLGIEVVAAADAETALRMADVVITVTTAATPLFAGELLAPGTHITAAGANALIRRELDEVAVRRANIVCVDARATAERECGDLLPLLEKGRSHPGQWVELGALAAGQHPGRTHDDEMTLFESQGMAIQDLAVAKALLDRSR